MRDCLDRIEWWLRNKNRVGDTHRPTRHELRIKVDTGKGPRAALIDTKRKALIATGQGPTVGDALAHLCTLIGAPT